MVGEDYGEFDSGMVGTPKDVVIDDDEVAGDGVAFVVNGFRDTFRVDESDRKRASMD